MGLGRQSPSVFTRELAQQQLSQQHSCSQGDAIAGGQQPSDEGGDGHTLQELLQHGCWRKVDQLDDHLQSLLPHLHQPSPDPSTPLTVFRPVNNGHYNKYKVTALHHGGYGTWAP